MKNINKVCNILSVLTAICLATNAEAQLILNFNTATETFSLSGSDTGTPVQASSTTIYNLSWEFGTASGVGQSINSTSGLDVTGLVAPGQYDSASLAATDGTRLALNIIFDNSSKPSSFGTVNLAGNGTPFSYSTWAQSNKDLISSLTNSDLLTPNVGTGTSNVQINVIPEPSSAALIGLAALGYGLLRRRRVVNA